MIVINFEYYLQSTWLWLKLGRLIAYHLPLSVRALCRGGQPGRRFSLARVFPVFQ